MNVGWWLLLGLAAWLLAGLTVSLAVGQLLRGARRAARERGR